VNPDSVADSMKNGVSDVMLQQILIYNQRHDPLTGLLTFPAFKDALTGMLADVRPDEEQAVVWIDLLNVRREFSLWGWDAAESLIRGVGLSLESGLARNTLIGRFGGRCFAFAVRAAKTDLAARKHIQDVVDTISRLGAHELDTTPLLSAGVAFYPSDASGAEELIRFASMAAGCARHTHGAMVLPFQHGMNNVLVRHHKLEVEIGKALAQDQFTMFYQPNVDLITGKVLGAEALMRWNHPEWGPVAPSEFIPVAERSNLIHGLFDFSLRSALKRARAWNRAGIAPGIIAVNVSPANLRRDDFPRRVRSLMEELPIAPMQLELEITESLLLDDEQLFAARMRQLKTIGVRLAIDDFGTRYTGFNLLKRLPLDAMKIDRCFIRGIHRSEDMRVLCRTIVAMARQMKLRTVAEGIEEMEELEVLQEIGCDDGQGYLFQRPLPMGDFEDFLRAWPKRSVSFGFEIAQAS